LAEVVERVDDQRPVHAVGQFAREVFGPAAVEQHSFLRGDQAVAPVVAHCRGMRLSEVSLARDGAAD